MYGSTHFLVSVLGDAWNASEQWQFGVRCLPATDMWDDANAQLLAEALAAPTQTFFTASWLSIPTPIRLTSVKVARIQQDGHYPATSAPGQYFYNPPVAGTSTAPFGLPQATIAISLKTGLPRGRAARGRFYLPTTNHTPGADGRITDTGRDGIRAAAVTWLQAINATAQVSSVAIMSKIDGTYASVEEVGCGRVIDTMRSRRAKLAEEREYAAV